MKNIGQNDSMIGIVFIHGAGLKGEIWNETAGGVDAPSLLIDLPLREGKDDERLRLGLSDYCETIKKRIDSWPVRRFVIVAHSIGGVIALRLANGLQERVVRLIGVGASIPHNGGSFLSSLPFPKRTIISAVLRLVGTKPPGSAIQAGLCNDLSIDQSEAVVNGFVPEARRLYSDRSEATIPNIPAYYVKLMKDQEFSPALQERMAANLAAKRVYELNAGHLPMISDPVGLSGILQGILEQLPATRLA